MNPRRGITATSAAVRRRRRSGEARAIRRRSGECRLEAASAREVSDLPGFVKRNPTILKGKQKAASLSRSSRPWGGCYANLDSLPFFAKG